MSVSNYGCCKLKDPFTHETVGGELSPAEEEGGKNSSQYFIKYLSKLIMLKMYRKCTNTPFTPFLIIEMLKSCLA